MDRLVPYSGLRDASAVLQFFALKFKTAHYQQTSYESRTILDTKAYMGTVEIEAFVILRGQ